MMKYRGDIMKKYMTMIGIAVAVLFPLTACAGHAVNSHQSHGHTTHKAISGNTAHYVDYAKIVFVEAVYRESTTKRLTDCHDHTSSVTHQGDGNLLNEALGGIIGGAIGNQIGKGSGKTAATIAGIIIGGSIANKNEGTHTTQVTRTICDNVVYDTVRHGISHYNVTYEYGGKQFTLREINRPHGQTKRMTIQITPYR